MQQTEKPGKEGIPQNYRRFSGFDGKKICVEVLKGMWDDDNHQKPLKPLRWQPPKLFLESGRESKVYGMMH